MPPQGGPRQTSVGILILVQLEFTRPEQGATMEKLEMTCADVAFIQHGASNAIKLKSDPSMSCADI